MFAFTAATCYRRRKSAGMTKGTSEKVRCFFITKRGGTAPREKGGKKPGDGPNLSLYASLFADVRKIEEDLLRVLYLLALERPRELVHRVENVEIGPRAPNPAFGRVGPEDDR